MIQQNHKNIMRLTSQVTVTSVPLQMALLLILVTKFSVTFSRNHYFLHTGNYHSVRIIKTRFISNIFANLRLLHHISTKEKLNRTD